jgi:glycosyltransferase involved in cell wall biosynthesis
MKPLLSIIIPTKNRYNTLLDIVVKLSKWNEHKFEVIIQDNSEDNFNFIEKLNNIADTRMNYYHQSGVLSVVENATLAIQNSRGDYVCFLGDDDGIIEQIIQVVEWMKLNEVDSLNCAHGSYHWPDYRRMNYGKKMSLSGMLLYWKFSGKVEEINPTKSLKALLENGALRINNITRVYHGVVSRKILEELKTLSGSYFPGPVADMSSAVGLSFVSKKHYFIDYPLIIAGASAVSYAGKTGKKLNETKIEKQTGIPKETLEQWSEQLPKYMTGQTIWPESALQALKRTGNAHLISLMNFPKIYGEFLVDFPELKDGFDEFFNNLFLEEERADIIKQIESYSKKYKFSKLKYWIKVYAVYFNLQKIIKLKRIDADSISLALTKLEANTELYAKTKKNYFSEILNGKI